MSCWYDKDDDSLQREQDLDELLYELLDELLENLLAEAEIDNR